MLSMLLLLLQLFRNCRVRGDPSLCFHCSLHMTLLFVKNSGIQVVSSTSARSLEPTTKFATDDESSKMLPSAAAVEDDFCEHITAHRSSTPETFEKFSNFNG